MKPVTLFTLLCCIAFDHSFAQNRSVTKLFKNDGQQVNSLDSADFARVVTEPDSGSKLFSVNEYYKDKTLRLVAESWDSEMMQFDGQAQWFYPSGKKKEIANFHDRRKNGDDYLYYPNGKIYLHKKYLSSKEMIGDNDVLFLDYRDSAGTSLASDGEGHVKIFDDKFTYVYEEGQVKKGLRDGEWKGDNGSKDHHISFTEVYDNGTLKTGESVHSYENKTYTYTQREVQPQFTGGITAFGNYLGKYIRYPSVSKSNKTQGRVLVSFVVETNGSLIDFKVMSAPNELMAKEAVRVLRESPKWVPGYQFGKVVRVAYTVPINFVL